MRKVQLPHVRIPH